MAFSLKTLLRARGNETAAYRLYAAVVAQARRPEFYAGLGVPDSPAGRFSMIALHGFLAMDRLSRDRDTVELAQALFDVMFADVDRNLREMGVGDLSVGRQVKQLARHFYGMADALRAGLQEGPETLDSALRRNVYAEVEIEETVLAALRDYVRASAAELAAQETVTLVSGDVKFGELAVRGDDGERN